MTCNVSGKEIVVFVQYYPISNPCIRSRTVPSHFGHSCSFLDVTVWFQKLAFLFGRFLSVLDPCVCLQSVFADFGLKRPILYGIAWFNTLESVFGRYRLILDTFVRFLTWPYFFWTIHWSPFSGGTVWFWTPLFVFGTIRSDFGHSPSFCFSTKPSVLDTCVRFWCLSSVIRQSFYQ